jgi:hypothetical protein
MITIIGGSGFVGTRLIAELKSSNNVFNLDKRMSYFHKDITQLGNIVAFIKSRLEICEEGYNIFNYADKPDFSMTNLTQLIEKKMKINLPKQKIPYWLGILGGYGFDFISFFLHKKTIYKFN